MKKLIAVAVLMGLVASYAFAVDTPDQTVNITVNGCSIVAVSGTAPAFSVNVPGTAGIIPVIKNSGGTPDGTESGTLAYTAVIDGASTTHKIQAAVDAVVPGLDLTVVAGTAGVMGGTGHCGTGTSLLLTKNATDLVTGIGSGYNAAGLLTYSLAINTMGDLVASTPSPTVTYTIIDTPTG